MIRTQIKLRLAAGKTYLKLFISLALHHCKMDHFLKALQYYILSNLPAWMTLPHITDSYALSFNCNYVIKPFRP